MTASDDPLDAAAIAAAVANRGVAANVEFAVNDPRAAERGVELRRRHHVAGAAVPPGQGRSADARRADPRPNPVIMLVHDLEIQVIYAGKGELELTSGLFVGADRRRLPKLRRCRPNDALLKREAAFLLPGRRARGLRHRSCPALGPSLSPLQAVQRPDPQHLPLQIAPRSR